jgi:hypothetical protein
MALHHFPRIVTDGLVLCLDAGNPLSYPVGPELWDGTVSPTILNFGGTTGYYDIATKTMHSPTSAAYVDRPRFTFNLGLTAGKLYSIVGMLSGDLDDLTTGGRVNPNITLNTATGEINTTFTAVNESIWFVFNANFSPSSVTIESLSVREVTSVWKDLSGNGNHGTLVNGVAYNSANKGSLIFDGSNDFISISSSPSITTTTPTIIVGCTIAGGTVLAKGRYGNYWNYGMLSLSTTGLSARNNNCDTSSGSVFSTKTGYAIFTARYNGSGIDFYRNGIYGSTITGGCYSPAASNSLFLTIGCAQDTNGNGAEFYSGSISFIQIYNRSLTPQEIQNNYLATKGRYGL